MPSSSASSSLCPPARSPATLTHWHEKKKKHHAKHKHQHQHHHHEPSHLPPPPAPADLIASVETPLASIGVLTDIQYSSAENGSNYHRTETRYYRHSIRAAERAMADFITVSTAHGMPIHHVLHLGDLIDGMNKRLNTSERAIDDVLARLPRPATARTEEERQAEETLQHASPFPQLSMYHLCGNHEMVNAPRSVWLDRLGLGRLSRASVAQVQHINAKLTLKDESMFPTPAMAPTSASTPTSSHADGDAPFSDSEPLYYDFTLANYRFLMLDSFDVALHGRPPDDPIVAQARACLDERNLHPDDRSWHTPHGPTYETRRFVAYNGGIGEAQLQWMVKVLEDARQRQQYVLLCSHVPFDPRATQDYLQVWNQHELLELIEQHHQIVATLHGHDHRGGHHEDENGVHHHVFEAILTAPDERSSHGLIELYSDRIEIRGVDLMTSWTMNIPQRARQLYATNTNE